jgi:hypothetical protein
MSKIVMYVVIILNALVDDMRKKKRTVSKDRMFEQIGIGDIKLRIGDKLYQNGKLYAEVMGESEELYFLQKSGSSCDMPSPYFKDTVIDCILFGKLFLEQMSFQ